MRRPGFNNNEPKLSVEIYPRVVCIFFPVSSKKLVDDVKHPALKKSNKLWFETVSTTEKSERLIMRSIRAVQNNQFESMQEFDINSEATP